MKIKLIQLNIKNFKGIKFLSLDFQGKNTNIFGANATGKTSIFDSFKWLLVDKDSTGRKDFCYKTLDSNNNIIHNIETEVEAILDIEGVLTTLKRINKEKWVKKRGNVEQTFDGNNSEYFIDDVPCKLKEYTEKLNDIIPDEILRMIIDPTEFCMNLSWQKRKEKLFEITQTNITDEDILKNNKELSLLLDKMEGKTISDYKKIITEKIKLLNKKIEEMPVRIDEATKNLESLSELEVINFEELEVKKQNYKEKIEKINTILFDAQKRTEENNKLIDKLSVKKLELSELENSIKNKEKIEISNKKVELENKLNELTNNLTNSKANIRNFEEKIKLYEEQRKTLRIKLDEIKNKTFELDFNLDFICPTCKQALSEEDKEKQIQQLEDNFNTHKKAEIDSINIQGRNAKKSQEEYENWLNQHQDKVIEINTEIEKINTKIIQLEETSKYAELSTPFNISNNAEFQKLSAELKELEIQVNDLKKVEFNQVIIEEKQNLEQEIEKINQVIAQKESILKTQRRVEELELEEKEYANQIQEYQQLKYLTEEFDKIKIDTLENSINKMFSLVKFKLLTEKINGAIQDTCIASINGVPFDDLNNAHKIITGLDIINTLMNYYHVSAPIFIDNAESIVTEYKINSQIIRLVVSNDKTLKVEVE